MSRAPCMWSGRDCQEPSMHEGGGEEGGQLAQREPTQIEIFSIYITFEQKMTSSCDM